MSSPRLSLQTASAKRDVYLIPPHEGHGHRMNLWLLLTAADGLVSANIKWQCILDHTVVDIGLTLLPDILQLF